MKRRSRLNPKKRYLQIALNGNLEDARAIIATLPRSERIILEVGTPMIKRYGVQGIRQIHSWYTYHLMGGMVTAEAPQAHMTMTEMMRRMQSAHQQSTRNEAPPPRRTETDGSTTMVPYIVADMKMMDRGDTEVSIARDGGADGVVALGHAPTESLDTFINACRRSGLDAMIDMMNVPYPLAVLRELKEQPDVVILHRGVDETAQNKGKMLPLYEIRRIKSSYDMRIAVAGGDSIREVQSALFNDADIVVVWKDFYAPQENTSKLAHDFLSKIK